MIRTILATILAVTFCYPAQGASFFYRGTDFYLNPAIRSSSIGPTGGNFNLDLGFDHDLAGSGIYLNGFVRGYQAQLPEAWITTDEQSHNFLGGGAGLGYRLGRIKVLVGGYNHGAQIRSLDVDQEQFAATATHYHVRGEGLFTKVSYYLIDRPSYSLQLDAELQWGVLANQQSLDLSETAMTIGLSSHFGKFCGGKALAVGAIAVAIVGFASLACRGNCFYGFHGWPESYPSSTGFSGDRSGC